MNSPVETICAVKFSNRELQDLLNDPHSHVQLKQGVKYPISLLPSSLNDVNAAVIAILKSHVMTYIPQLKGILLSYKNIKRLGDTGTFISENYRINVVLLIDLYIFTPKVNCILKGVVNKKSEDNIGCLVHKEFNVAIPRPNAECSSDWPGNSAYVGQEVLFRVDFLNIMGSLPYIRGTFIDETGLSNEGCMFQQQPGVVAPSIDGENDQLHVTKRKKKKDKYRESEETYSFVTQEEPLLNDMKVKKKSKKKKGTAMIGSDEDIDDAMKYLRGSEENDGEGISDTIDISALSTHKHKKSKKHKKGEQERVIGIDPIQLPSAQDLTGKFSITGGRDVNTSTDDNVHKRKKKKRFDLTNSYDEISTVQSLSALHQPLNTGSDTPSTSKISKKKTMKSETLESEMNVMSKKSSKGRQEYDSTAQRLIDSVISDQERVNKKSTPKSVQEMLHSTTLEMKDKKKKKAVLYGEKLDSVEDNVSNPDTSIFSHPNQSVHTTLKTNLKHKEMKTCTSDNEESDIAQDILNSVMSELNTKGNKHKKHQTLLSSITSEVQSAISTDNKGKKRKNQPIENPDSITQALLDSAISELGIKPKKRQKLKSEQTQNKPAATKLTDSVPSGLKINEKNNDSQQIDETERIAQALLNSALANLGEDEEDTIDMNIVSSPRHKKGKKHKKEEEKERKQHSLLQIGPVQLPSLKDLLVKYNLESGGNVDASNNDSTSKSLKKHPVSITKAVLDSPKSEMEIKPKKSHNLKSNQPGNKSALIGLKIKNTFNQEIDETDKITQALLDSALSKLDIQKKKKLSKSEKAVVKFILDPNRVMQEEPSVSKQSQAKFTMPDPKSWDSIQRNVPIPCSNDVSSTDEGSDSCNSSSSKRMGQAKEPGKGYQNSSSCEDENIVSPYTPARLPSKVNSKQTNQYYKTLAAQHKSESSEDEFDEQPPVKKNQRRSVTTKSIVLSHPHGVNSSESSEDEATKEKIKNLINTLTSKVAVTSPKKSKKIISEKDSIPSAIMAKIKKKSKNSKEENKSVDIKSPQNNNIALELLNNFLKKSKGKK